ncbi:MAG: hypothetical protein UR46_C0029G0013, partial [Parcubacteria group bacterium GW2011_GWA1_33_6]
KIFFQKFCLVYILSFLLSFLVLLPFTEAEISNTVFVLYDASTKEPVSEVLLNVELNEENILCILSEPFGLKMREQFNADLAKCKEINLDVWRKRPFLNKILEWIFGLVGHQL